MPKTLLHKYKNLHLLVRFVVNIALLACFWFIFYQFFRYNKYVNEIYEYISNNFTQFLLHASKTLLSVFGIETSIHEKTIKIANTGGILLDRGCLARNLLGLFVGFVLAYPSKIIHKIWAIPLGIIFIIFLNIFRISALTFLVYAAPEYVDVNHHIVFKYVVYFFIFCMWYFWIKYFSITSKNKVD